MNNDQFRRLIASNATKSSTPNNNNGASSTPSRGVALGSRQKSSIPMTPRSVAGRHKSDFARQLAEQNQPGQKEKKFRSFAPKGSKLAEGYVDRTQTRQSEEEDDRAARLKALEEALKKEEIDQQTFDNLRSQIAGGDLSSTHLVKGLDFKLLERVRKGEDVYRDGPTQEEKEEGDEETLQDVDDELDRLQDEEVAAVAKEKTTKKGHLSTAPTNASRKRTRDQILAEMKAARDATKAKESTLGNKFRRIGIKSAGTRIERDSQGREVMIIVDEDGNEKRKVRKTAADTPSQKPSDLMMPDPKAKPLGMEVPDIYKPKTEEPEEEDVNIFDDVDDDYDPLAGLGEDSDKEDEEENENESSVEQAKATDTDKEAQGTMPPPPRPVDPTRPRNYFQDSKTSLVSSETLKAPSMSDPAIQAAFKKAASLHAMAKSSEEDDEEAKSKAERRRRMLENTDRDAEDMDMGFGTSRFEDDADLDEQRVKLSEWGRDDDDDEKHGRGGGSKRKRGPKKRKGDSNSATDVLREMERQRAAREDVFAILLGAYHPGIKLLGISTVHGNASLKNTTNNALSVLAAIGKEDAVRVYPGATKGLKRDAVHAVAIHGESGLDGTDLLPPPALSALDASTPAVDAMARALRAEEPGTAWVVATGALTNVAALFAAHPDLREHVAGLSIMGGSVGGGFTAAVMGRVDDVDRVGNYSQWAEFNILIDPEAAAALLHDPILAPKTTLVPLDLTHLVLATKEVQELLLRGVDHQSQVVEGQEDGKVKAKSTLRQMLVELLMFFAETYRDHFGIVEGPPLHDPLAVAAILVGTSHEIPFYDFDPANPEAPARRERFEVRVVTEGTLEDARDKGAQTGRTLVRLLRPSEDGVRIPRGVDIELFWKVIEECCQRADEANAKRAGTTGQKMN
ncbi:inosine-uridine preferring nucleoside hydrolase-domain-containing protein [Nemania sp. FL0031]|nr:inosine-uridine preferring nucleoside hydrolase-domain-containing protein [Nemania sp. FL0031]